MATEQEFTKRQAERILRDALRMKSSLSEKLDHSQLVELGDKVGIERNFVNQSIQRAAEVRKRTHRLVLSGVLLAGIGIGAGYMAAQIKEKEKTNQNISALVLDEKNGADQYVNATVLDESGEYDHYVLTFRSNNNIHYTIQVLPAFDDQANRYYDTMGFEMLRKAIKKGSLIAVRKDALDKLMGISGVLGRDEIRVLKQ